MTEAEWIAFLQRPEIPAFNRAMLENPDDDLPRLVFADWMDENCPDTAVNEAVRGSIVKPNVRPRSSWPEQSRRVKQRLLFVRGRLAASGSLKVPVPTSRPPRKLFEAVWRAGWVESVGFGRMSRSALAKWSSDPMLSMLAQVWFSAEDLTSDTVQTILASPNLSRLTSLAVSGWWRPIDWLSTLADLPAVARLERLNIIRADLRGPIFAAFIGSPRLSNLRSLALKDCHFDDAGVTALANSPHLRRVEQLEVYENRVSDAGAAALANSPYLCEAIRAQWRRPTDGLRPHR